MKALFPKKKAEVCVSTAGGEVYTPGVCVVLGAGNQNFLTAVDVLEAVFMQKQCVLLKHHPLRPFLTEPLGHILQPLAEMRVFAHVLDSDVRGAHAGLVAHQAVTRVHMTGSAQTHNRVVASLKAAGRDDVVVTSELGNVTPWIVCPGSRDWTKAELEHHAGMLAQAVKTSGSCNCIAPKLVVLPAEEAWPQRPEFLAILRRKISNLPQPPPYYPGTKDRWEAFAREYPDAETIPAPPTQQPRKGQKEPEPVPAYAQLGQDLTPLPTLLIDVGELGKGKQYAAQNEAFAPVLAIATVTTSADQFPIQAARAVNEHAAGTLSCMLSYLDERGAELDAVVAELNYGTVGVNVWTAYAYGFALSVWGGAPGSYTKDKPCSGLGFVGNAAGIPNPSKGVVYSAFENGGLQRERPIPFILLDSLNIIAQGKKFASARIMGVVLRRGFGLFPRRMPQGENARGCRVCF